MLMVLLVGGAQVIGKIVHEGADYWKLEDARILAVLPPKNGKVTVRFLPLVFAAGPETYIQKSAVCARAIDIDPNLEKSYREHTSGLVLPGRS